MITPIRYWLIRKIAGKHSVLLNAKLDGDGCTLRVPALVAGNTFHPGVRLNVVDEEGRKWYLGA